MGFGDIVAIVAVVVQDILNWRGKWVLGLYPHGKVGECELDGGRLKNWGCGEVKSCCCCGSPHLEVSSAILIKTKVDLGMVSRGG